MRDEASAGTAAGTAPGVPPGLAPGPPPTVRQIYAIAAALCEQVGAEFPRDRGAASQLIRELRGEEEAGEQRGETRSPSRGGRMAK